MAKRKKTDIVQFKLRIREALRRRLEAVAKAEERSLNTEIGRRLELSFEQEEISAVRGAMLRLVSELEARVDELKEVSGPPSPTHSSQWRRVRDHEIPDWDPPKSENPAEGMEGLQLSH